MTSLIQFFDRTHLCPSKWPNWIKNSKEASQTTIANFWNQLFSDKVALCVTRLMSSWLQQNLFAEGMPNIFRRTRFDTYLSHRSFRTRQRYYCLNRLTQRQQVAKKVVVLNSNSTQSLSTAKPIHEEKVFDVHSKPFLIRTPEKNHRSHKPYNNKLYSSRH